jgi:iron complex outermembrane receptor protein
MKFPTPQEPPARRYHRGYPRNSFSPITLAALLLLATPLFCSAPLYAQETYQSPTELKKLPLEELVDVEIMSAARRPEPLSQAASAIDVITADDIERAGVTNIPDALRLGTEMQVAQIDGHDWAISTRGFNISGANKMQVLMDGRSLYTPLYSGVFWDVQQTFLPDLARIEIIRGPGATLWGANAVNGVINILTKSARDTQGLLLYGGGGDEETDFVGLRYGGRINQDTYYRAYVMHSNHDSLTLEGDGDAGDETDMTQGGFRIDATPNSEDTLTLQGDGYGGHFGQLNGPDITVNGGNVLGRWTRQLASDSSLMLQTYLDYTHRLVPDVFEEHRGTFDIEFQHRLVIAERHDVIWGANYRLSADDIGNLGPSLAFVPDSKAAHLVSAYVQDEFHLVPGKFSLIAGAKFEYNSFSGFEIQPSGRFVWTPTEGQTVWGAISRAVRTPTRVDQDLVSPNPSTGAPALLIGSPDFESETLIAYELGYRIKPWHTVSIDLAGYYNDYDNLRSIEPLGPGPTGPFVFKNKLVGSSYGGSLSTKWKVTDWWELSGWVSLLHEDIHPGPGSADVTHGTSEGNDPNCTAVAKSSLDLPHHVKFDAILRYVDDLPHPATPAYLTADVRIAWSPYPNFEVAFVGRNLFDEKHPEFSSSRPGMTREVGRGFFGTLKWHF